VRGSAAYKRLHRATALLIYGGWIVDALPDAVGNAPSPNEYELRVASHLRKQAGATLTAFYRFLASLVPLAGATYWVVASEATPVSQMAGALFVAASGSLFGIWVSRREAGKDELEPITGFAEVFLHSPATLHRILNERMFDEFVKSLLSAILGDEDLGQSVWNDVVSRMVDDIDRDKFRVGMTYEIRLADFSSDLQIPHAGVVFPSSEYRVLETELSYLRKVSALGDSVDIGLILDPLEGLNWFRRPEFFEREYLDVDSGVKNALRSFERTATSAPLARTVSNWAARLRPGDQRRRAEAVRKLASPTVTIGDQELQLGETSAYPEGIALRFPIPPGVRSRCRDHQAVRVTARLAMPILRSRSTFPFVLPELTRGTVVTFDHSKASGVYDLQSEILVSGGEPFANRNDERHPDRQTFATDPSGWLLPGSGVIFSWRND